MIIFLCFIIVVVVNVVVVVVVVVVIVVLLLFVTFYVVCLLVPILLSDRVCCVWAPRWDRHIWLSWVCVCVEWTRTNVRPGHKAVRTKKEAKRKEMETWTVAIHWLGQCCRGHNNPCNVFKMPMAFDEPQLTNKYREKKTAKRRTTVSLF